MNDILYVKPNKRIADLRPKHASLPCIARSLSGLRHAWCCLPDMHLEQAPCYPRSETLVPAGAFLPAAISVRGWFLAFRFVWLLSRVCLVCFCFLFRSLV